MKKLIHQHNRKTWILFLVTLGLAIVSLTFLPERLPIHFNVQGEPDNFAGKWSIFLAPAMILFFIFLAEILRTFDPKRKNYDKFESYYYGIHFSVGLLMFFVQVYTITYALGWQINLSRLLPPIIGLLFVYLGNIMPKFKHNYFVGIRTPWTLASEQVWYLTHRFGGKVFVLGGLFLVVAGLLGLPQIQWLFVFVVVLIAILPLAASFYYFKKEQLQSPSNN